MAHALTMELGESRTSSPRFSLLPHVAAGIAIGLVATFAGLLGIFGVLLGFVLGANEIDKRLGRKAGLFTRLIRLLAVTSGIIATFILGGISTTVLATFAIAPIVVLSERESMHASPRERLLARSLLLELGVLVALATSFVLAAILPISPVA